MVQIYARIVDDVMQGKLLCANAMDETVYKQEVYKTAL